MKRILFFTLLINILMSPAQSLAYFTSSSTIAGNTLGFGDWTAPHTTLLVSQNGEQKHVQELMVNGDFSDGLNGWTSSGNASSTNSTAILGDPIQSTANISTISQIIPNTAPTLSFTYQLSGGDIDESFIPIFTVSINDQPVYQTAKRTTDFVTIPINLSAFPDPSLVIKFSLEQDPRISTSPHIVAISHVGTSAVALNPSTTFSFSAEDKHTIATYYHFDAVSPIAYFQPFSLSSMQKSLTFWSSDPANNTEDAHIIPLIFHEPSQEIHSFTATREPNGEAVISFISSDLVQNYDIRISETLIDQNTSLDLLPKASIAQESLHAPLQHTDHIFLDHLDDQRSYFLAIRAIDAYGNISQPVIGGI